MASISKENIKTVLSFWFDEHGQDDWYTRNDEFDDLIRARFSEIHRQATAGQLSEWRDTPEGRLAEIIVLDQFSRNIYRNSARSFEWDGLALELAKQAIDHGDDQLIPKKMRAFVYLPFMHSEELNDHETAIRLFEDLGEKENLKYEMLHKDIIERFGRYPHRNEVMERTSTPEEEKFLADSNSFKG